MRDSDFASHIAVISLFAEVRLPERNYSVIVYSRLNAVFDKAQKIKEDLFKLKFLYVRVQYTLCLKYTIVGHLHET
jgi:hypothetical protein